MNLLPEALHRILSPSSAGIGRPLSAASLVACLVGIVALVAGEASGHAATVYAVLDASWLFFGGLAAGSVALVAAIRIAHGRWAAPVLPLAEAGLGFLWPGVLILVLLSSRGRELLPGGAGYGLPADAALVVPAFALLWLGDRLVSRGGGAGASTGAGRADAVGYVAAYAIGLSLWAYELVIRVAGGPPATVIPAYYFFGALLSALAWIALLAAIRGASGPDLRHDLGKLLFAFIVVWTYLLWALFLPTWYGNIPDESGFLLRRWHGPYRPLSVLVIVAVFFWPFWLLFSERLKRRRTTLAIGAATVLAGLAVERFLLVLPSLRLEGDAGAWLVGAGVTAGVAGVFLLAVGRRLGRVPTTPAT